MIWFVLFLCVLIVLLYMQCRFLERSIERLQKQNEHIQHHLAQQNEQLERFKSSLSERFAYKEHFKQEQQKIEQVRIDLRDFFDFYYETLDEQTRTKFVQQIWKINLFDETKKS